MGMVGGGEVGAGDLGGARGLQPGGEEALAALKGQVEVEVRALHQQVEELENQVRDLTSSHESKGGEASLDMTQWASVRAFDRARLWRETLASLPYVLGTTISRGGLLFTKRKPKRTVA